jgi:hypothetical protein
LLAVLFCRFRVCKLIGYLRYQSVNTF